MVLFSQLAGILKDRYIDTRKVGRYETFVGTTCKTFCFDVPLEKKMFIFIEYSKCQL